MIKVDRDNGGYITTSGNIAWPARHYWWEVVGYDVEADCITHSTTFEAEEAAQAAYDEIKSQEGARVMTGDSRPDLEYIIADGVEYVLHAHEEQTVYYVLHAHEELGPSPEEIPATSYVLATSPERVERR